MAGACYYTLIYSRASRDGWAASAFHSFCDSKGPTVVIVKSGYNIFGGYTAQHWECKLCVCAYLQSLSVGIQPKVIGRGFEILKPVELGLSDYARKHPASPILIKGLYRYQTESFRNCKILKSYPIQITLGFLRCSCIMLGYSAPHYAALK